MKKPLFYLKSVLLGVLVMSTVACQHRKYTKLEQISMNSDSLLLARANFIADSIARANFKPDTTVKIDTAKLLSNPDYAFVHRCFEANCKQMEVIHFGIVNGFDKRVKLASKKMMTDHEKMNAVLREYAATHNVPLSNDTTIDMSFANTMDGVTWDSTWMDMILTGQTAMRADLSRAQNEIKDEQLRSLISRGLPDIDRHLEVAGTLKKSY